LPNSAIAIRKRSAIALQLLNEIAIAVVGESAIAIGRGDEEGAIAQGWICFECRHKTTKLRLIYLFIFPTTQRKFPCQSQYPESCPLEFPVLGLFLNEAANNSLSMTIFVNSMASLLTVKIKT